MLAASDLGPASDEVVGAAAALAERLGAELHLMNALEIESLPDLEAPSFPGRIRQAESLLSEQARRAAGTRIPTSLRVLNHAADQAIAARAKEVGAGVVVIGPHRGGEAGARFLGTTAEKVIRGAEVPVLVVRGRLGLPLRRIGVPTDFSDASSGALDVALALAGPLGGPGTEIRLVHAGWTVERADGPGVVEHTLGPKLAGQAEEAVARAGGTPHLVRTEVSWGVSPTDTIIDHARKQEIDLIVIGTQGQGGLRRLIVGSVASGLARQAPCSVLLVPPSFGET